MRVQVDRPINTTISIALFLLIILAVADPVDAAMLLVRGLALIGVLPPFPEPPHG